MIFKIVIIGGSCSGKTAWMKRVAEDNFNVSQHDLTIGVDFAIKQINGDKLQIWDTAGSESFRSIVTSYYRGSDCIIIMCDLTRRDSFDKMNYRYDEIMQYCTPGTPVFLVATKMDLVPKRVVSLDEIYQFATSKNISHNRCFVTSAKTSEGVHESIQSIYENLKALFLTYSTIYGFEMTYTIERFKEDFRQQYTREKGEKYRISSMLERINNPDSRHQLNFHTVFAHTGGRTKAVLSAAGFHDTRNVRISADGKSVSQHVYDNRFLHNNVSISLNSLLSTHAETTRVSSAPPTATTNQSRIGLNVRPVVRRPISEATVGTTVSIAASAESQPLTTTPQSSLSTAATMFSFSQNDSIQAQAQARSDVSDQEEVSEELLFQCPISYTLMQDPVILETGHTYERKNIVDWLRDHSTCPTTGIVLKNKRLLIPNIVLRHAIEKYGHSIATKQPPAAAMAASL